MSDKTYWVNKTLKRQYAKSDFIRADGGHAPAWMSTVTIVGIAVLIMGALSYFTQERSWTWLALAIAGAVATAASAIYSKVKDLTSYAEFILRYKEQEILFQYIGKKHIVVACDGKIFEFKNKQVTKVDQIYRPYMSLNAIADNDVVYETKERKGEFVNWYAKVEKEEDGKKVVYNYKVKLGTDNHLDSYKVNGCEVTFSLLRKGEQKLSLPINLYNELRSAGIELPGDDVITLVYNF